MFCGTEYAKKLIFSSPQICLQAQPKSAKTQFIVWKTTIIQKLTGQQEDSKVVTDKSNYRTKMAKQKLEPRVLNRAIL